MALEIIRLDLHCHSYYSDGTTSPADLLQRAENNGVTHLAITDHDCVDALDAAAICDSDVVVIPGVEISTGWQGIEVHIVGLFVDRHDAHLKSLLLTQQTARRSRVEKMSAKLEALGTPGLMAYLDALPAVALTRSHVANFLVESGVCKTRQKSFKSHLSKRGKIYVESRWCGIETAIHAIHQAGGIAVLAHPGRYPISKSKLALLLREFKAEGGIALEGSYPNIDPNMMKRIEVLANECGLLLSCGSDFHDPEARWTDLGKFPRFGQSSQALGVWHHPIWQSHIKKL